MNTKMLMGAVAIGVTAAFATDASALTLRFGGVSQNNSTNTMSGEDELTVDIFDPGGGLRNGAHYATFRFEYSALDSSAITDIYFDDGTLLGAPSILNGPGVHFVLGASPDNLPAGNELDPPFEATVLFNTSATPPMLLANGVGNGEYVELTFALINGKTFADTLAAIDTGELRIGLKVQGFADGGSESFIALPPGTPIPLPSATLLGLAGLSCVAVRRRRLL